MTRTVRTFALAAIVASFLIIQGCSTESSVVDTTSTSQSGQSQDELRNYISAKAGPDALARILHIGKYDNHVQAAITYAGTLCPDVTVTGTASRNSIYNSAAWTYYKFYGVAGETITVRANRTGCGIDPALSVYYGTTTDNAGVNTGDGGPDMTFLAFGDDNFGSALGCGCYADPYVELTLAVTGWYTVAVYDFLGCGSDINYDLTVTGNICDSDGDGVNDDEDAYPNSDMSENVTIDGCDSGVDNHVFADGSTMMDLINDCAATATNHGGFTSCVSGMTNTWKSAGFITGAQKGSIQSCAANAAIP